MISHPLTWAFWATVLTGVLLYGTSARRALDVVLHWAPVKADGAQLRRERGWETAALIGRWSLGGLTMAALLGLVGITGVWHGMIPGAMCGTGVLQAMGAHGGRAMVFWILALLVLYGWRALDRLDSHHPDGPLTPTAARVLLAAAPMLVLAVIHSWQALMHLETIAPVSCCAAVYDQVLQPAADEAAGRMRISIAKWGSLAGGGALMVLAGLKGRYPARGRGGLLAAVALVWGLAATIAVAHVWSAYYYQVLSHPCPWCLFLPDYYGAGFFIYGSVALAVMEGVTLWLADHARRRHPLLADAACRTIGRAARRMMLALIVFTLLTAGPALAWRLRTGVWLDGTL